MPPRPSPSSPLQGGCQCSNLRYAITGPVHTFYACHCRDCQKQSASAFGLSFWISANDFKFVQGEVSKFETRGDSGAAKIGVFCRRCGTRILNRGDATGQNDLTSEPDELLSVKGGSLDSIHEINPVSHIWLGSAQPWVRKMIETTWPEMPCFEGEPDDEELLALWRQSGQV